MSELGTMTQSWTVWCGDCTNWDEVRGSKNKHPTSSRRTDGGVRKSSLKTGALSVDKHQIVW